MSPAGIPGGAMGKGPQPVATNVFCLSPSAELTGRRAQGRVGVETFLPGFEGQLDSQLAAPPPNTPPQGGPYHGSTDGGPLLRAAVLLVVVAAISVLRPGGGELLDVGLCSVKLG